ncbi:predicted protein [Botrytis cinerea T4]|uniref:Uncharacterized protein n=1 Tax=Botryotinia fuckeliana (strain T4) TaxID=999810 RepID=G2Y169_BOTF4|nr:predicted protein [Botrytis cinerea T4]
MRNDMLGVMIGWTDGSRSCEVLQANLANHLGLDMLGAELFDKKLRWVVNG